MPSVQMVRTMRNGALSIYRGDMLSFDSKRGERSGYQVEVWLSPWIVTLSAPCITNNLTTTHADLMRSACSCLGSSTEWEGQRRRESKERMMRAAAGCTTFLPGAACRSHSPDAAHKIDTAMGDGDIRPVASTAMGELHQNFVDLSDANQDATQESLTAEVKEMLQKCSDMKSSRIPSNTVTYKGSASTETEAAEPSSTQVASLSSDERPTPHHFVLERATMPRHKFVDISETKEENKKLKDENFELKKEIFILRRELPNVIGLNGNDITAEYIDCRDKLFNEQTHRMELQEELRTIRLELGDKKRKYEEDKEEWKSRWKRAVDERDSLSEELAKARRELLVNARLTNKLQAQVAAHQQEAVPQPPASDHADSTLGDMSIVSTRDMQFFDGSCIEARRELLVNARLTNKLQAQVAAHQQEAVPQPPASDHADSTLGDMSIVSTRDMQFFDGSCIEARRELLVNARLTNKLQAQVAAHQQEAVPQPPASDHADSTLGDMSIVSTRDMQFFDGSCIEARRELLVNARLTNKLQAQVAAHQQEAVPQPPASDHADSTLGDMSIVSTRDMQFFDGSCIEARRELLVNARLTNKLQAQVAAHQQEAVPQPPASDHADSTLGDMSIVSTRDMQFFDGSCIEARRELLVNARLTNKLQAQVAAHQQEAVPQPPASDHADSTLGDMSIVSTRDMQFFDGSCIEARRELLVNARLTNKLQAQVAAHQQEAVPQPPASDHADSTLGDMSIVSTRDMQFFDGSCIEARRELLVNARLTNKLQAQVAAHQQEAVPQPPASDHADSTLGDMSIVSTRDMVIEELKGTVIEMTVKKDDMLEQIDALRAELETHKKIAKEEREMRALVERKLADIRIQYEQLVEEKLIVEARHIDEVEKLQKDVNKRDKAINSLLKKLDQTKSLLMMNTTDKDMGDREMMANERGTFDANKKNSQSFEAEGSTHDAGRIHTKEVRAAETLAGSDVMQPMVQSFTEMLPMKLKVSDNGQFSVANKTSELDEASMTGLFDCSIVAVQRLDTVGSKIPLLHDICRRLFEKLRGCADFLQSLLAELGSSEKGQSLIEEIRAMRLDFDQSELEANEILKGVEEARRGIDEFKEVLSRSIEVSMINVSTLVVDNSGDAEKVKMQKMVEETQTELLELHTQIADRERQLDGLKLKMASLEKERCTIVQNLEVERSSNADLEKELSELRKLMTAHEVESADRTKDLECQVSDLETRCAEAELKLQKSCAEVQALEERLKSNHETLKSRDGELCKIVEKLRSREEELTCNKNELAQLAKKADELMTSLKCEANERVKGAKEAVASEEKLTVDAIQSTSTRQLSQISLVSDYISVLGAELGRVRTELEVSKSSRDVAENKCRALVEELNAVVAQAKALEELVQARALTQSKSTQSDLNVAAIGTLEANIKRLEAENSLIKENFNTLYATVAEKDRPEVNVGDVLEPMKAAFDADASKRRGIFVVSTAMGTSLCSTDIDEMEEQLKAYKAYATDIYKFLGKWSRKAQQPAKSSFSSADLSHMYEKIVGVHRMLEGQVEALKDRIKTKDENTMQLARQTVSSSTHFTSPAEKELTSKETVTVLSAQLAKASLGEEHLMAFRTELSVDDFEEMFRSSNCIVETVKKLLKSNRAVKEEEKNVAEILMKARRIRSQLSTLCIRIERFEKAKLDQKENMDPNDDPLFALQNENVRLQLALNDAKETLKAAYEKLSAKPDTAEMSERIVRELQKILRTMKSTKREARFLDENRKRKNAEDNAGTS
ncbi:hypothetical protein Tcan_06993 [Toxocara canis]|uniref:Uncharacterized protein n=1 Tax=Toxocara canis TaxID=6265 RepID=A0A0B2W5B5_TOXCA|nr:hypothetical protein Tcan_06993 [Toxocara canis]